MCDRGIPGVTERQDRLVTKLWCSMLFIYEINSLSVLITKTCEFSVIARDF